MNTPSRYERATKETAENLQKVAKSLARQKLTTRSLPELDAVVDLVSKIIPAGNVPGMILSGLSRIYENQVQPQSNPRTLSGLEWVSDNSNDLFRILWLGKEVVRCEVNAGKCDFYVP